MVVVRRSLSCRLVLAGAAVCAALLAPAVSLGGEPSWAMKEGVYSGRVVVPNPDNWMVGLDILDEECEVTVREGSPGHMAVKVDFIGVAVQVPKEGIQGGPFYVGDFGANAALVVQTNNDGHTIDVTHTTYDTRGDLNYGISGDGDWQRGCHMGRASWEQ